MNAKESAAFRDDFKLRYHIVSSPFHGSRLISKHGSKNALAIAMWKYVRAHHHGDEGCQCEGPTVYDRAPGGQYDEVRCGPGEQLFHIVPKYIF